MATRSVTFDLAPMVDAHRGSGADVTMAVVPNPTPNHYNGLVVDDEGVVTGFRPRGQAEGTWHFVGVQVARSSVFADLPDGVPSETVAGFYRDVIRDTPGRIRAWHARTSFLDVGTPRDYLQAALVDLSRPRRAAASSSGRTLTSRTARTSTSASWPARFTCRRAFAPGPLSSSPGPS